jgi:hypothetical protein
MEIHAVEEFKFGYAVVVNREILDKSLGIG